MPPLRSPVRRSGERRQPSENKLHLHPHAPNSTIRVIAVQKTAGRGVNDIPLRHVHELRMVERVLRFPAKLQPLALGERERLEQAQIKIVRPVGKERVAADRRRIRKSRAFHPKHVRRSYTSTAVRTAITCCTSARPS